MLPYAAYCGAKEARKSLKSYMAKRKSLKEAKRLSKLEGMSTLLLADEKDGKKADYDALTESTDVTSCTGDESVCELPTERPEWWTGEWPPKEEQGLQSCPEDLELLELEELEDLEDLEEFHDAREDLPAQPKPGVLSL